MGPLEHPVPLDSGPERVARPCGGCRVVHMGADGIHPVLEPVLDQGDRQPALVGPRVAGDHGIAARTVLQQPQVALAFIEEVLLQRGERQVQVQAGEHGRIALDGYRTVVFPHIGLDAVRAHPEEDPVHLAVQLFHHIGDQLQVTLVADAARPADARPPARLAAALQSAPPARRQAVLHHPHVRVDALQGFGQGVGRDDEAVHHADGAAQLPQNVLGHLLAVRILERQIGQVVVQLGHHEHRAQALDALDELQLLFVHLALQHQGVGLQPVQLLGREVAAGEPRIGNAAAVHGAHRLDHPVVAAAGMVGGQRQHDGLGAPRKGAAIDGGVGLHVEAGAVQREVGVVGRVACHDGQPLLVHRVLLAHEACPLGFLRGHIHGLLAHAAFVQHDGVGRPDDEVAGLPHLEAQVHIVVRHLEGFFVQPADLFVDRAADHQAGGGDRAVVLVHLQAIHVTGRIGRKADEGVVCRAAQAQHDAAVLDGAIGVQQLGPHDADLGPLRMVEHGVQPVAAQRGRVVVQQDEVLASRHTRRRVVDGGIVERMRIAQHADARVVHRLQPVQPRTCGKLGTLVVHQDDFVILVGGLFQEGAHASLHHGELVLGRDDDGDGRRGLMAVVHPIAPRQVGIDPGLHISPRMQVPCDGRDFVRAAGQLRQGGNEQRLADMADGFDPFGHDQPQDQIQFRCLGDLRIETVCLKECVTPEEPVPCHALGARKQQVQVEVGAEQGSQAAGARIHQLVCIDGSALRGTANFQQQGPQAVGGENLTGLHEQQPAGTGRGHLPIGNRRPFGQGLHFHMLDPGPGRPGSARKHGGLQCEPRQAQRFQAMKRGRYLAAVSLGITHEDVHGRGRHHGLQMTFHQLKLGFTGHARGEPGPQCIHQRWSTAEHALQARAQIDRVEHPWQGQRRDADELVVGRSNPPQLLQCAAEVGVAFSPDMGVDPPEVAGLLIRDAQAGQWRLQQCEVARPQQLDMHRHVAKPVDGFVLQRKLPARQRQHMLPAHHDGTGFADEIHGPVGQQGNEVPTFDEDVSGERVLGCRDVRLPAALLVDDLPARGHERDVVMPVQHVGKGPEASRQKNVVVVEKLDVGTAGQPDAFADVAFLPQGFGILEVADGNGRCPRLCAAAEVGRDRFLDGITPAVIANHDLEAVELLRQRALQRGVEIGRLVGRDGHRDLHGGCRIRLALLADAVLRFLAQQPAGMGASWLGGLAPDVQDGAGADAMLGKGRFAQVIPGQRSHRKTCMLQASDEVLFRVEPHVVVLSEPAPALFDPALLGILVRGRRRGQQGHHQDRAAAWRQDPVQLAHRPLIVVHMLQDVRADDEIEGIVRIDPHVGDVHAVIREWGLQIRRPVIAPTETSQHAGKRRGRRYVQNPQLRQAGAQQVAPNEIGIQAIAIRGHACRTAVMRGVQRLEVRHRKRCAVLAQGRSVMIRYGKEVRDAISADRAREKVGGGRSHDGGALVMALTGCAADGKQGTCKIGIFQSQLVEALQLAGPQDSTREHRIHLEVGKRL